MKQLFHLWTAIAPNHPLQLWDIWEVTGRTASSQAKPDELIDLLEGESLDDALMRNLNYWCRAASEHTEQLELLKLKECLIGCNEYHPRIYRPISFLPKSNIPVGPLGIVQSLMDNRTFISSLNQLSIFIESLEKIFRTIHPEPNNLSVYGHEVRNLLLLACMEVEAQCKGILKANNYASNSNLNTNDYVKLLTALRLNEYEIEVTSHLDLPIISPFLAWDKAAPTQSLTWYDAYNAVKHDREVKFDRAKLEYAIHSVVACAVMLIAQWGYDAPQMNKINNFFKVISIPQWSPEDRYYCSLGSTWNKIDYSF
jgi:hypothetical protein